jgi:hypothetical protein
MSGPYVQARRAAVEGHRAVVADDLEVRHETVRRGPAVEEESRRLVGPGRRLVGQPEVEGVRGAGTRHGDRARKAPRDEPVEVAAEHPLHLRVTADHLGQADHGGRSEPHGIHVPQAGHEGGVVQGDDGRRVGFVVQHLVEPLQLVCVEGTSWLGEAAAVERHDAQGPLDHAVGPPGAVVDGRRERLPEVIAAVVVARHEVHRHREGRQELREVLVLDRRPVVDEVAGEKGEVGNRSDLVDLGDGVPEERGGVDASEQRFASSDDVGVTQLHEEHAGSLRTPRGPLAPRGDHVASRRHAPWTFARP